VTERRQTGKLRAWRMRMRMMAQMERTTTPGTEPAKQGKERQQRQLKNKKRLPLL
jgi:hypothetical protein